MNNEDTDQHAHLHSLISVFVVRCLDSVISILAMVANTEDRLSRDEAHLFFIEITSPSTINRERQFTLISPISLSIG